MSECDKTEVYPSKSAKMSEFRHIFSRATLWVDIAKYFVVHFIFFCLYVNATNDIGRRHNKKYSELSDKEYEQVTLASIYAIIISVLTPVAYVYFALKYTFIAIGLTCKFSLITLPEYLVHLLFGRKHENTVKEVKDEAKTPANTNILSDYNAFLNK